MVLDTLLTYRRVCRIFLPKSPANFWCSQLVAILSSSPHEKTGILSKSTPADETKITYRLCRRNAEFHSYGTKSCTRASRSASCNDPNSHFQWPYHRVQDFRTKRTFDFVVYGIIAILPLQPVYVLLSSISAKAMYLSKRMMVAYATGSPDDVQTSKLSPNQHTSTKNPGRVNKSSHSDV